MGSSIECIKRTYKIQTSSGIKMEVESLKPLSGATTAKLLEDDNEISSFLENCKILGVEIPGANVHKKFSRKPLHRLKKKSFIEKIEHKESETIPEGQEITGDQDITSEENTRIQPENKITPCDRINKMITMEGDFTRIDYQKFMEDKGYRVSDFMGHEDIEDALLTRRIEQTGEKVGKGFRKYRIIDTMPVEEYMFRKIINSHRAKRKY